MASLKGSKTEQNLLKAFAGESQARNRYTYAASVAKKEGFEQIAAIFEDTANNEKEHAKVFFKHLEGGDLEITATYPAGVIGDTLGNLKAAAAGEKAEWGSIYPESAQVAKDEGFADVAASFTQIAAVEAEHEARYNILTGRVGSGTVFSRPEPIKWRCRNCGRVMEGKNAPDICPACKHPQAHYEPFGENY
jgi:rubrerythrin